jgi:hypothetical protein
MVVTLLTPENYPKYTKRQYVSVRILLPNKLGVLQR